MPVEVIYDMEDLRQAENTDNEEGIKVKKYRWNKTKATFYQQNTNTEIWKLMMIGAKQKIREEKLDETIDIINHMIEYAGTEMKERESDSTNRKNNWFDKECKYLKKEAKKKIRIFRANENQETLNEYTRARQKYKITCKKKKEEQEVEQHRKVEEALKLKQDKMFWKLIKGKTKQYKSSENSITEQEWIKHFTNLYANDHVEEILADEEQYQEDDDVCRQITEEEILAVIKELKTEKAPGIDGIPPEFYKSLAEDKEFINLLTNLFNLIVKKKAWPKLWRIGLIHTIHKKGDTKNPANYRGISLLAVLSKIFTKIISDRLNKWVENNNKLSNFQSGFRKGKSTIDNIAILDTIIKKKIKNKKNKLYLCFVDLRAAFDSINRTKLWKVLQNKGISRNTIELLKAIYNQVLGSVKLPNLKRTQEFDIQSGVRQGCHLSAVLFNLYLDELVTKLEGENMHAPSIKNTTIPILLYADDLVIIAESEIGLKRALKTLENFCTEKDLKVNTDKTKVMVVTKSGRGKGTNPWYYMNETIEETKEYCYLGLIITNNGKWKKCIEERITIAKNKLAPIRTYFHRQKKCSIDLIKKIFQAVIEPVILYGSEIWGVEKEAQKIDTIANSLAKEILGIKKNVPNKTVRQELGIEATSEKAIGRAITYLCKNKNNENKKLVKECIEWQTEAENENFWVNKIKKVMAKLNLTEILNNDNFHPIKDKKL